MADISNKNKNKFEAENVVSLWYFEASFLMDEAKSTKDLKKVQFTFEMIESISPNYEDCRENTEKCQSAIDKLIEEENQRKLKEQEEKAKKEEQKRLIQKKQEEAEKKEQVKKLVTILSAITIVIVLLATIFVWWYNKSQDYMFPKIEMEFYNRTQNGVDHLDRYVTKFSIEVTNNGNIDIKYMKGMLVIYDNVTNQLLYEGEYSLNGNMDANSASTWTISLYEYEDDDLYNTDISRLDIKFNMTYINFNNTRYERYDNAKYKDASISY